MPPKKPPERMTLAEFRAWLTAAKPDIHVEPYNVRPCTCDDVNCHGWRLVRAA